MVSPILFGIYLYELLLKLNNEVLENIRNIFTGTLTYADDVVLLALTKHATGMSLMLKTCSEFEMLI